MGKGGGCVPSKKRQPPTTTVAAVPSSSSAAAVPVPREAPEEVLASAAEESGWPLWLYIVFYSMNEHVEALARHTAAGAGAVEGVEVILRWVPETLPPEVLEKMQVPAKDPAVLVITAPEDLEEADGVLFGFPTRYGAMAAQMKAFFDSTGSVWEEQRLVRKLAGKPARKLAGKTSGRGRDGCTSGGSRAMGSMDSLIEGAKSQIKYVYWKDIRRETQVKWLGNVGGAFIMSSIGRNYGCLKGKGSEQQLLKLKPTSA